MLESLAKVRSGHLRRCNTVNQMLDKAAERNDDDDDEGCFPLAAGVSS